MKFLSVRELRANSAKVWGELLEQKEMVVTSNGHPIAVLSAVSEANLEQSLAAFRQARAIEAAASIQRRSVERGTDRVTTEQIDAEIKEVRKRRSR